MKKSSLVVILTIFILPLALYYFFKMPEGNNYSAALASSGKPKVLQFSAAMCSDCKRLEREIAPLRAQYSGKVIFQKIDVNSRNSAVNSLISQYGINVVPTLVFLDRNGNLVQKIEGYITRQQIRECLDRISHG